MTCDLAEYLDRLYAKGFKFGDETIRFIYFGKSYTGAVDSQVISAIELTLKIQKSFEGSFFMSLLEIFVEGEVMTKAMALEKVRSLRLLV
ncbi:MULTISPECIES: DUF6123 family protein [Bacillaceae]|uniref:Uncharacterized protein n=2 Tax=Metabacillus TaxID=2675233 RepID=A0ABS5LF10_9BACI|nr:MULTISPECIES: DUF6123 family protein [Bacillaceae]KZZ82551.1 hypothetical protein AS29_020595 [Bacillus sp. SJS]MBS2969340.1 hypothetical protein [Metabacillus flavus]